MMERALSGRPPLQQNAICRRPSSRRNPYCRLVPKHPHPASPFSRVKNLDRPLKRKKKNEKTGRLLVVSPFVTYTIVLPYRSSSPTLGRLCPRQAAATTTPAIPPPSFSRAPPSRPTTTAVPETPPPWSMGQNKAGEPSSRFLAHSLRNNRGSGRGRGRGRGLFLLPLPPL